METMKAAVLRSNRSLSVESVQKPSSGNDGILVKVKAVGVCGSDMHSYKTGLFKDDMGLHVDGGILMGHEIAGEVVEVGSYVTAGGLKPGDRVAGMALGAYAEFCKSGGGDFLDEPTVFKIPDHISYEEAATVEPLTVSLMAVRRAAPKPGEKVLIIGAGAIGLGCVQILHALYPECDIAVCDVAEERLAMAEQFGATQVINAQQENIVTAMKSVTGEASVLFNETTTAQVDIVIEAAGLDVTFNQALEVVKPHAGRVVMVALYEDRVVADLNQVVSKNIDLYGMLYYTAENIREAVELISSGVIDRKALVTHHFELDKIDDAFKLQIDTNDAIKVVIVT